MSISTMFLSSNSFVESMSVNPWIILNVSIKSPDPPVLRYYNDLISHYNWGPWNQISFSWLSSVRPWPSLCPFLCMDAMLDWSNKRYVEWQDGFQWFVCVCSSYHPQNLICFLHLLSNAIFLLQRQTPRSSSTTFVSNKVIIREPTWTHLHLS